MQMIQHSNFFHYVQNDDRFYHITCQIILHDFTSLDDHNYYYDHGFFYNNPTANYYITCKRISNSSIVDILNKIIYGIYIGINNLERKESLSLKQQFDLEQSLRQILPSHLTQPDIPRMNLDRNLNSSYGHNTQLDSQPNFGNSLSQQSRVEYSTNNNVINPQQEVFNSIPQQFPEELRYNSGNTNSFCGNTGNNVMTTQAVPITDSQSQPINSFAAPQNGVIYYATNSQQQIDLNYDISRHVTNRELKYRNTNSFHGNIMNNSTLETQSVLATDINGARSFVYTQQQADLNDNYKDTGSHNGNIGDNAMATQVNNYQVSHNYVDTNSHNGNIGNNVIATQTNGLTYDHQDMNNIHQQSSPSYQSF